MKTHNAYFPSLTQLFSAVKTKGAFGLTASVLASTFTVLSSSSLMASSAYIISFAALQPSIADIMVPVTAVRFFGISRAVLRYGERLISHNTVFSYLSRLRVWLYEGVSRLSGEQLLTMNRSDALNVLTTDIETLQDFFLRAMLPMISTLLIGIIIEIILIFNLPILALGFAIFYPIATFGMAFVAWKLTKGANARWVDHFNRFKTGYNQYAESISELHWNLRETDYNQAILNKSIELEKNAEAIAFGKIIAANGQQLLINFSVLFALMAGIQLVVHDQISGIFLAVVTLVMFSFYEAAPAFLTLFQKLESSEYSASRMIGNLFSGDDNTDADLSNAEIPIYSRLNYQDISFCYKNSKAALEPISLSLERGKRVAIVGASGSGKSTLSALLCGLMTPHSGVVMADGMSIPPTSHEMLMSQFSVINQDVYLFHKRLKDNLLLGNFNATDSEIFEALRLAGLSEWIDTDWLSSNPWIGQNGQALSGGQRQRVALARALLKDAPFILLDEAFAGLDIETEAEVLSNLLNLKNKGLVWITHRLIQMETMDEIYVLSGGKLVGQGTHEQLLIECPLYAAMSSM